MIRRAAIASMVVALAPAGYFSAPDVKAAPAKEALARDVVHCDAIGWQITANRVACDRAVAMVTIVAARRAGPPVLLYGHWCVGGPRATRKKVVIVCASPGTSWVNAGRPVQGVGRPNLGRLAISPRCTDVVDGRNRVWEVRPVNLSCARARLVTSRLAVKKPYPGPAMVCELFPQRRGRRLPQGIVCHMLAADEGKTNASAIASILGGYAPGGKGGQIVYWGLRAFVKQVPLPDTRPTGTITTPRPGGTSTGSTTASTETTEP